MNEKNATGWIVGLAVMVVMALFVFSAWQPPPAQAQSAPDYGSYYFTTAKYSGVPSTVAEELLPAPGAEYRWVVTGINRETLVAEASKAIQIVDHSGSEAGGAGYGSTTGAESVVICEFAPTTAGQGVYHNFDEGIVCSVNSAVVIEGISTSSDCWIEIQAYKQHIDKD